MPEATHRAAGILFVTKGDRQALFLKRGPGGDYPSFWCFPGGHYEPEDGSLEATACREAVEEIGSLPDGTREVLARNISTCELPASVGAANGAIEAAALPSLVAPEAPLPASKVVDFTTYVQAIDAPFDVVKDGEHVGYAWAPVGAPPEPLHPGCRVALDRLHADELGVARMMAAGLLTSPQRYKNVTLWAMRITGTGVAYRRPVYKTGKDGAVVLGEDKNPIILSEEEFPWRDPELYLNDEFLARCNGLPVIGGHPKDKTLDSKEFARRIVGTIFLPYIRGDVREVWGIAKVWDDEANAELAAGTADGKDYSTSPAVVLSDPANPSFKFRLESGELLLVEGKPSLLDHLAICERGVWDKGGEPAGIINETDQGDRNMSDEVKADSVKEPTMAEVLAAIGAVGQSVVAIGARVDSMEESFKAKSDADDKCDADDKDEKKSDEDDKPEKKSDADDKDEKVDAEDGKAEKVAADAKADAEAARADAASARAENVALTKRLAAIEAKLPQDRSDDDHRSMSGAQARADAVASLFGKSAPRFLTGEGIGDYRRRLVRDYQEHSPTWKTVDVGALPDSAFDIAEAAIYVDAAAAAANPGNVEDGGLRMVHSRTASGHQEVKFYGHPSAWMGRFAGSRRYATRISPNTKREAV
jgi:8-oxo-dGTP pyrophosphatase MutT (NUDIX family)